MRRYSKFIAAMSIAYIEGLSNYNMQIKFLCCLTMRRYSKFIAAMSIAYMEGLSNYNSKSNFFVV